MHGTTYWIKQGIRNTVSKRSDGKCYHCGKKATKAEVNSRGILAFYDEKGVIFHLDHLKPVSEGGEHTEKNLVISCKNCNMSKRRKKIDNDPEAIALMKQING